MIPVAEFRRMAYALPADPMSRFVAVYEMLDAERGWFGDPSSLRFAAMAAVVSPGEPSDVAKGIRRISEDIKTQSGWFGALNSPLRFIVSAMLYANGDSAADFLAEVETVEKMFRAARLRRGGIYEIMAILIMRLRTDKQPIASSTVDRFQAIYEEMKRHHWWLTGPDDFPACAILVGQPESPVEIGERIEQIYQSLHAAGLTSGDPLHTAANLLYLARLEPAEAASRFRDLAHGFRESGVSIWQSDYDEVAILTFLDHTPTSVITRVLSNRAKMEELRPKPDRSLTFNLAASITFLELVKLDRRMKEITDAKALMDMQAIINAQQAAAGAAASSAAVCAASSASAGA
jgi:Protein of unknown function (DUF4003)